MMNTETRQRRPTQLPLDPNALHCILMAIAWLALAATIASAKEQVVLGPPESGTWSGSEKWLTGANGAGATSYDFNDASHGACAFVVSNSVAGKENTADWRCPMFPLGPAAGGARPITFSFSYKLPGRVAPGDDVHVQLRFFDATTNGAAARRIMLGTHTGDSAMESYRTLTMRNIRVPKRACLCDITIIANIDGPWTSGTARFDDFSVTTEPGLLIPAWAIGLTALLAIGVATAALLVRSKRSASGPKGMPAYR